MEHPCIELNMKQGKYPSMNLDRKRAFQAPTVRMGSRGNMYKWKKREGGGGTALTKIIHLRKEPAGGGG